MPSIDTSALVEGQVHPENLQIYCGLDSMLTHEVHSAIKAERPGSNPIYTFERALQGPALEMMLRGWRIDEIARRDGVALLRGQITRLCFILDRYVEAISGHALPRRHLKDASKAIPFTFVNSNKQLAWLFHSIMGLPEQFKYTKGERKRSFNREALEKLQVYFHAQPVILCILAVRALDDQLSILETQIDSDGRLRQSYNITGTETGRPSSSENAFGTGTNVMNITSELRNIFIADQGWKMCALDFEQSEARDIGWWCWLLFGDSTYLDHCESYDLHTATARLVWPQLKWSKDKAENRRIAEQPYYRHFTYRAMAKRGGHACNYLVSALTMSRHLKIELKMAEEFQHRYFSAYKALPMFHRWVAEQIQTRGYIDSYLGGRREFFGRPNDEATLREAVAHCGQNPTANRTSLVMWRIWQHMPQVQILNEVYDAVDFQYRPQDEAKVLAEAQELSKVSLEHKGRHFIVPCDLKVGWNWAEYHEHDTACLAKDCKKKVNPNGLKKWNGSDHRTRLEGLSRVL